jgi:hypothetical protein
MKNFKYRDKQIEFLVETGEVLSQSRLSKTHVSTTGGSRYTNSTIYSRTETDHDFWIRTVDGREVAIKLKDRDIQIREQQIITVISARLLGQKSSCKSLLINHTANTSAVINSGREMVDLLGLMPMTGKSILFTIVVVVSLAALGFSDVVFQGAGWLFIIYRAIAKSRAKRRLGSNIDEHLVSLATSINIPAVKV